MKIKSLPQYERPMEKCLSLGVESLTNGELIAILINSGTKERSAVDLAEEVLAKDQAGIGYLRESSLEELMTVKGIGSSKAARIVAAVELGKRIALKPVQKGMKIQDDEDVAELFMEEMRRLKKEMFKAVLKARPFDSEEECLDAVLKHKVQKGDAVFIRYEGP